MRLSIEKKLHDDYADPPPVVYAGLDTADEIASVILEEMTSDDDFIAAGQTLTITTLEDL